MFSAIIINIFEMIAVISGFIFIKRYPDDFKSRYFLYFLVFTLVIDLSGWLPYFIHKYKIFSSLQNTIFARNEWIFNIYDLISFCFFLIYISSFYIKKSYRNISRFLVIGFLIFGIVNLYSSDQFYDDIVSINFIVGGMLVFIHAMFYFFQITLTDKILLFYRNISFYLILGLVIYNLVLPPIFIYSGYYVSDSPRFVYIHRVIMAVVNVIVYSCYTFGFLICSKTNKSYS